MLEFHNFFFDLVILKKSLELKAYCSNGHAMANLFLKDAIYKKRFPLLLLEKNPVTNLGCEGTWHLYKLATNWTLVYGHLNLTPGWSFQSIFGHFWTNGHEYDWISRPRFYLLFRPGNSIPFIPSEKIWALWRVRRFLFKYSLLMD